MYTPKEVGSWVLTAPEGNVVANIVTDATHLLPGDLGRFVQLLDEEGYIFAMWQRKLAGEGQPIYIWHLQRRRRVANSGAMTALIKRASVRQPVGT